MNHSIKRYIDYSSQIDADAYNTRIDAKTIAEFAKQTSDAGRIFITGTGTSLPTALYLTTRLQEKYDKQITFLPTAKMIRKISNLNKTDLVIMISHGFNRADARIIYDGASTRSKIIVITGNKNAAVLDTTLLIIIPPEIEKIFCRPISPITTLLAIQQLLGIYNELKTLPKIDDLGSLISWIDPNKQTIVLYSAGVSFSAELWDIVLREGAGLNVLTKDIENYSHGYYGVDTADLKNRQFIILTSNSKEDIRDFARAKELYNIPGLNKHIVTATGDEFMANLALFVSVPEVVKAIILRTNRDMDHPKGMEENRKYHEYDCYPNYIEA